MMHRWCYYIQIAHHKSRNSTVHGVSTTLLVPFVHYYPCVPNLC